MIPYRDVLRELAREALAAVATEPRLERKRALAAHALEDLELAEGLAELGMPASGPLARVAQEHATTLDARTEEAVLRRLTELHVVQERHAAELPVRSQPGAAPAREPWIEAGVGADADVEAAIAEAEAAAAAALEADPPDPGLARAAAEALERAQTLERDRLGDRASRSA